MCVSICVQLRFFHMYRNLLKYKLDPPIIRFTLFIYSKANSREEILGSARNNGELLHEFSDGSIFQQHDLFKSNPYGLQIIAYYDEVETCNPLGSSSGKYKLGCLFFTLGNIRPSLRSGLKSTFLLSVAKSPTIKANGIDSILKPFLADLKTLYEVGITVQFAGKDEVWRGALLAFLADNLAAHELGGFKE